VRRSDGAVVVRFLKNERPCAFEKSRFLDVSKLDPSWPVCVATDRRIGWPTGRPAKTERGAAKAKSEKRTAGSFLPFAFGGGG
jgi:hypothetical protein